MGWQIRAVGDCLSPCRGTSISTVSDGKILLEDLQKTMATTVPGTEVRNITLKRVERMAGHHPQCKERIEVDYLFGGKTGDMIIEQNMALVIHTKPATKKKKKKPPSFRDFSMIPKSRQILRGCLVTRRSHSP